MVRLDGGPAAPLTSRAPALGGAGPLTPTPAHAEVASLLAREAQRAPVDGLAATPVSVDQAEALGQQFEALLLRQLVEAMSATVPDSGLMGPASGPKTLYQDMITDALATQVARSGGLGIARLLEPTLGRATEAARIPADHAVLARADQEK